MVQTILKIAFRYLLKYKTQHIISIFGLAVGFVCFAFSALWIRYVFHLLHDLESRQPESGGGSEIRDVTPASCLVAMARMPLIQ